MKHCVAISLLLAGMGVANAQTEPHALTKINGTSLYITSVGQGPGNPIVVVHGGPGLNQSYLIPHLKGLEKSHRLIFYDQRASGRSATPSPDSISLDFFVNDIEGIRQSLHAEKIDLLAHSWGAIPALLYARKFAAHTGRIVLVNPVPLNHDFDSLMMAAQNSRRTNRDSTDQAIIRGSKAFKNSDTDAFKKLLMLSFRHSFYKQTDVEKLTIDLPADYSRRGEALYQGLQKDMGANFYDSLRGVSSPVLILHGSDDMIPLAASQKIAHGIPGSTIKVVPKCGHFVFIEQPSKFKTAVNTFFTK